MKKHIETHIDDMIAASRHAGEHQVLVHRARKLVAELEETKQQLEYHQNQFERIHQNARGYTEDEYKEIIEYLDYPKVIKQMKQGI